MAFVRTRPYLLVVLLLLIAATPVHAQKAIKYHLDMSLVSCLDVKLPVTFSWINYEASGDEIPAVALQKIEQMIIDHYLGANGGDSSDIAKAMDDYFNTLRIPFNNMQLFVVILKTPLSYARCKLFLYDSASNKVSNKIIDYNTWAMYTIEDNVMRRSEFYKAMHLDSDDIAIAKKKKTDLLLRRVKHDEQHNDLEEIIYHPNGLSLDTQSYKIKTPESPDVPEPTSY